MSALDEFAALPLWVTWRSETRQGKPTKVPYEHTGSRASSTRDYGWASRAIVEREAKMEDCDGIGIMLARIDEDRHLGGVDLDACLNDEGDLAPWAREVVELLNSYTEVSPSGRGLKVFFTHDPRATLAEGVRWRKAVRQPAPSGGKEPGIEFYLDRRYFTVTDQTFDGFDTVRLVDIDTLSAVQGKMAAFEPERRPDEQGEKKTRPKPKPPKHHPRRRADEHDLVIAAMPHVANGDLHWNDWSRLGMALHNATGGSEAGYRAFLDWSAKSSKHNAEDCAERWQHWHTSPADDLSAGTILYEAALGGWKDPRHRQEPPPPTAEHEGGRIRPDHAEAKPQPNDSDEAAKAKEAAEFEARIKEAAASVDEAEKKKRAAEAKIEELSKLNKLDYDLARKEAAKELDLPLGRLDEHVKHERGGRTGGEGGRSLEPPEPWPKPVDGIELLNSIAAGITRHVSVPTRAEQAIALWVVHTHALAAAANTPRLAVLSPLPECGKSTLLDIIGSMVPCPLAASNISPAATFRAVELLRPTLVIDEADTFLPNNDELRAVLNSGHSRAQAFVWRAVQVGDDYQPRKFATWAACAIALIGTLPATLASRSIPIALKRLTRGHRVERYRSERQPYADLGRKAARWAADNLEWLSTAEPEIPKGLANRSADNWRALLAIADRVGGDWPVFAREAALTLTNTVDSQTLANLLLADIRTAVGSLDRISSKELVARLLEREGQPWPEMPRTGKPITPNGVARLLKPFGVFPRTVRIDGVETSKGYMASDLQEAFGRYLPPTEDTEGPAPPV